MKKITRRLSGNLDPKITHESHNRNPSEVWLTPTRAARSNSSPRSCNVSPATSPSSSPRDISPTASPSSSPRQQFTAITFVETLPSIIPPNTTIYGTGSTAGGGIHLDSSPRSRNSWDPPRARSPPIPNSPPKHGSPRIPDGYDLRLMMLMPRYHITLSPVYACAAAMEYHIGSSGYASVEFLYKYCGSPKTITLLDCIEILYLRGIPSESTGFGDNTTIEASKWKIAGASLITSVNDLKHALMQFGPCVATLKSYDDWKGSVNNKSSPITVPAISSTVLPSSSNVLPSPSSEFWKQPTELSAARRVAIQTYLREMSVEELISIRTQEIIDYADKIIEGVDKYRSVAIVGYTNDAFIIRGSWGTEWGDSGYGYWPFNDWAAAVEVWVIEMFGIRHDDSGCIVH